jgi:hypothetical protein
MITGSGGETEIQNSLTTNLLQSSLMILPKGIATLRLDDRGIGGSTKGTKNDTSANFATDI